MRRRLTVQRALEIAERLDDDWLRQVATGSVRFEPITTIELVGVEWVYDIAVTGLSNFVANDITVKNSGAIEETADFLVSLYRPDDTLALGSDDGNVRHSGKLKMDVLKSRHGGKGRNITLQMDMLTLAIVDEGTPEAQRAHENTWSYYSGTTWEDLRKVQTAPVQESLLST